MMLAPRRPLSLLRLLRLLLFPPRLFLLRASDASPLALRLRLELGFAFFRSGAGASPFVAVSASFAASASRLALRSASAFSSTSTLFPALLNSAVSSGRMDG